MNAALPWNLGIDPEKDPGERRENGPSEVTAKKSLGRPIAARDFSVRRRPRAGALTVVAFVHVALGAALLGSRESLPARAPEPLAISVTIAAPETQPRPMVTQALPIPRFHAAPNVVIPHPEIATPDAPTLSVQIAEPPPAQPMASAVASAKIDEAVVPPSADAAYLNNPPPAYPPLARRAGEAGRVQLRVLVNAEGRAEQVEIDRSSGFARLDQAALEAVRNWRFVPATRGQEKVTAWAVVPVNFRLS